MRTTSIPAILFFAFINCVLASAVASGQQQELTSNVFAVAAPPECLVFSAWGGQQAYEAGSDNATEKLMSEPEIKEFVEDMIRRTGLILPAMDSSGSKETYELLHQFGPKISRIMLTKPGSFFVESFDLTDRGEPENFKAAMLIDAGQDAAGLAEVWSKLLGNEESKQKEIAGVTFNSTVIGSKPSVEVLIGHRDNVLLIAIGQQTLVDTMKRLKEAKNIASYLSEFQSSSGVRSMNSLSYINVKSIRQKFVNTLGIQADAGFRFLGLGNATAIETCSGLGPKQWLSRVLVKLEGKPEGLLGLSDADGLSAKDLSSFPKDSLFAMGASLDAKQALAAVRLVVSAMSGGRGDFNRAFREIEGQTGVNVEDDIFANLGSSWTLYNGAGDGWFAGLAMTTSVKDVKALNNAIDKIVKFALLESRNTRQGPEFARRKFEDHTITSIRIRSEPFPLEPSWCIADDQFVFGLYPQAVESALKRTGSGTLVQGDQDRFLRSSFLSNPSNAKLVGMTYVDAATNFEVTYPYLQMMITMGQSLFDQNTRSMPVAQSRRLKTLLSGVRIPRARVISRNLEPSLVAIRQSDAGIEFEASQTIPSLDVGYAAPVIMAAVLPAVQQVRGAAQRVESQNNLRQQVLAALNYESAHQDFPQGYTVDKQGNKLLSWRVYVLPFIEQNRLFQQFKLDEPWDSPNNKKLIEKMPKTFRSPASNAKPGFTVYRGIGGKSGVLRGADEGGRVGFGNITDGSSNTIFLIETSDELAVPWTKPAGLNPDQFDRDKIFGSYSGGTNVARCDGSTLFMSDQIETISLRYMMKMNDGNIVRSRNLRPTARQRVEEMKKLGPIDQRFVLNQETKVLKLADILSEEDQAKLAEEDQRIKLLNRFRQIAIAMHNFESAYLGFPVAYSVSGAGQGGEPKPLLSWRVHILPYLDQQDLYRQFHLDEAWDSEHNKALVEKMPDVFVVDPNTPNGKTTIVGIGGKHGIIGPPKSKPRGLIGTGFGSISDGSSNTILLIDAGADQAVEWTKPTEFEPTAENLKNIIGKKRGFAMGDASTGYLKDSVTMETLQELLTMDGGEVVADGWRQRD